MKDTCDFMIHVLKFPFYLYSMSVTLDLMDMDLNLGTGSDKIVWIEAAYLHKIGDV